MKADRIIKNAKIFTADKDNPQATALVVKDGKRASATIYRVMFIFVERK